jgi:hypothetical protein
MGRRPSRAGTIQSGRLWLPLSREALGDRPLDEFRPRDLFVERHVAYGMARVSLRVRIDHVQEPIGRDRGLEEVAQATVVARVRGCARLAEGAHAYGAFVQRRRGELGRPDLRFTGGVDDEDRIRVPLRVDVGLGRGAWSAQERHGEAAFASGRHPWPDDPAAFGELREVRREVHRGCPRLTVVRCVRCDHVRAVASGQVHVSGRVDGRFGADADAVREI